jgi:hypothetical protein
VGGAAGIGGHDDQVVGVPEELEHDGSLLARPPPARREQKNVDLREPTDSATCQPMQAHEQAPESFIKLVFQSKIDPIFE